VFRRRNNNGDNTMNKKPAVLMFLLVLTMSTALITVPALAQMGQSVMSPVRCGTKLVQVGKDTKQSVLAKCGEPTSRNPGSQGGGETWFYDRGSGRFSGTAIFTGDKLTAIQRSGEYGTPQPPSSQDK
jgi:hypothetical protein